MRRFCCYTDRSKWWSKEKNWRRRRKTKSQGQKWTGSHRHWLGKVEPEVVHLFGSHTNIYRTLLVYGMDSLSSTISASNSLWIMDEARAQQSSYNSCHQRGWRSPEIEQHEQQEAKNNNNNKPYSFAPSWIRQEEKKGTTTTQWIGIFCYSGPNSHQFNHRYTHIQLSGLRLYGR